MIGTVQYSIPRRGYASQFAQSEQPIEFASEILNRYINMEGGAEKRRGMQQLGLNNLGFKVTNAHEHINTAGVVTLFVSGEGKIARLDPLTNTWSTVYSLGDVTRKYYSAQSGNKLIFVNSVQPNIFTDDGGNTFKQLRARITKGKVATNLGSQLLDSNINNWIGSTLVAVNDTVYFPKKNVWSYVASVGTSALQISPVGVSATGLGFSSVDVSSGDVYEIYDTVELNIIPNEIFNDNVGLLGTGSNTTTITVSAVQFPVNDVRPGDYVINTTQNAISEISVVTSAALTLTKPITGQTAGDTVLFVKPAMPIASWVHVHYGRTMYIDARDESKVRVSGPNDPEDMTTFQKTLVASSYDFGSAQPQADKLLALMSYQRFLIAGGTRNLYVYDGTDLIQDTSSTTVNFSPKALFTQGLVTRNGLTNIGNSLLFISNDGVRSLLPVSESSDLNTENLCEQFKSEITTEIRSKIVNVDDVQITHFPKRNWVIFKVGNIIYNLNYTPLYESGQLQKSFNWTRFNGKFAQQNFYFVRENGDLISGDDSGVVSTCDVDNIYNDLGASYRTELKTNWLTLEEGRAKSPKIKKGIYIEPTFEVKANTTYTISCIGDFDNVASDSVQVTASGVGAVVGSAVVGSAAIGGIFGVTERKLPLRWRGRQVKVTFATDDTNGPDTITRYTLYGNITGFR